ncbi:MAG: hypothetical protein WC901_05340 [Candidatus Margulisiibacteriota bacterium]
MESQSQQTSLDKVEAALNEFWNTYSKQLPIKGRHTEVTIKPRVFIGDELNPQIIQKIIEVYLLKMSIKHILSGKVVITDSNLQIKNDEGKVIVEISNAALIKKIVNQVTVQLGRHLAEKKLVAPRPNQIYCLGDIQGALVEYLKQSEKCDSKNLVRDATVLLLKDKQLTR